MWKNTKVLVTGGSGMVGRYLTELLIEKGANVRVVSLDDPSLAPPGCEFINADLTEYSNCVKVCKGVDIVFNVVGIKGSPDIAKNKPASFFVPTVMFNTNMMEAAVKGGVHKYLYTSTIGVYSPAEVFYEDDVWKSFPSQNDRFGGWAKRMGELQAEAYKIEYNWNCVIVRPANVYGRYDNFDPRNAMVIPSLISRAVSGESPLSVWGDGSAIRDFIHAKDVADGMLIVMERQPSSPVNLGSGAAVTIKQIAEVISKHTGVKIEWDTSKLTGDQIRLMDTTRARSLGIFPQVSIEDGIADTISWYRDHRSTKRYNVFA